MDAQLRVVTTGAHRLFREGLGQILSAESDIEVVGEAASAPQVIEIVKHLKPDLVFLDITMPGVNWGVVGLISQLTAQSLQTKTLLIGSDLDEGTIFKALNAGARGILAGDASASDFVRAVRVVHLGEVWLARKVVARFITGERSGDRTANGRCQQAKEPLTPRELEILRLLAAGGAANKDIAKALGLSHKTIKNHLYTLFKKLGVNHRLDAVLHAQREGLS